MKTKQKPGKRSFYCREGTQDPICYEEVMELNEYRLPEKFKPDDVIVDIGAHIGCFAVACLKRGAGFVHCYEPSRANFKLLKKNLAPAKEQVKLHRKAVWRSDVKEEMGLVEYGDLTAMHRLCKVARAVPTVGLDDILRGVNDNVRLLKLDCEGSEYGILMTCSELHRVDEIVGEYHVVPVYGDDAAHSYSPLDLVRFLEHEDFKVDRVPHPRVPDHIGWFFARRA